MKKASKAALILSSVLAAGAASTIPAAQTFAKSATHRASATVNLQETGSTLLWPLFQLWVPAYKKVDPSVRMTTSGTGSGTGISQATAGVVQIGASDAYMSNSAVAKAPDMLNIPLAISAQQIMYNIPGLKTSFHLRLTGSLIGDIYEGRIKYWDDAAIARLNRGVKLPHLAIVPIHRSDSSGDTFLFTQFMTDTNAGWANTIQYGTSVSWPSVQGSLGATGNQGVVQTAEQTKGAIAYVGISWLDKGLEGGLGEAALQNKAGRFLLPNAVTIKAAAGVMIGKTPKNERISLIYAPGNDSYPIINYEYSIIKKDQPNASVAAALKKFLLWAINPRQGNSASFMSKVHFLPLPPSIYPLSKAQIDEIQ